MLTAETKRHIDAARQVLVGKIPDPKGQVQEITNALVYKFMDDMDEKAASMGGKRRYFTGEYAKYSWRTLMNPKVGAHERIDLYREALSRLSHNKNLPELFRGIFRGAYLPFNDGRTLTLFLNEIDYFDYKNSEDLGNAYEYLLSIMGSQGDAGQFRTPRHIIDFIVKVINPSKDDSVLDPACGTAGFLISAYKHVISQHDGVDDSGNPNPEEKSLSADEKQKLHRSYKGFDIDDNMVKMAKVNLYLHGFPDPNILVHDTLSSEDFWQDRYDVILANPPFMTPKGGIVPHNKFSIKSNRSEVLFVDYIMNHLKPDGRAGIIVPEGIIFQSSNAHKQLRKSLIEDGLYAVVSLPSGVFNPYAGVKTSILLFDNQIARKAKDILFVKIEADGFDLGAQRRPIDRNDLPDAVNEIKAYQEYINTGKAITPFIERITKEDNKDNVAILHDKFLLVDKNQIKNYGDYNLSFDRYKPGNIIVNKKWPLVELGNVAEYINGYPFKPSDWKNRGTPIIRIQNLTGTSEIYNYTDRINIPEKVVVTKGDLLISWSATIGFYIWQGDRAYLNQHIFKVIPSNQIDKKYLYYLGDIITSEIRQKTHGNIMTHITKDVFNKILIPLPPLETQKRIVEELDGYQKIIDAARQIVSTWKPKIDIDPKWEKVKLGEVCKFNPKKSEIKNINKQTEVSFVPMSDLSQNEAYFDVLKTKKLSEVVGSYTYFSENDVLLARVTPCFENGKAGIAKNLKNKIGFGSSEYIVLRPTKKILSEIIYTFITTDEFGSDGKSKMTGTGGLQRVPVDFVKNWEIFLPPLEIQRQIVEKIEVERAIVESNKKLIEIYEQKIKDTVAKLWQE